MERLDPASSLFHRPHWGSAAQVAKTLGCSSQTVRNLYETGLIKGYRLTPRGWVRIDWASVTRYMKFVADGGTGEEYLDVLRREANEEERQSVHAGAAG